ncbi:hypothetical protein MtrunA17_Chr4g0021951 [Medicago truncatula]|uniref:Uncharacterized protein n=1 Tax=Medicago truncatula TaxID=3880 RepID=G7JSJ2_MEDTR|nr:hypothetical protein MTR_4g038340 [Medicago truncatula]RHN60120.1 hypothetical protein MtrunA17_Chr4g0021951 [Medicago truncatula]
MLKAMVGAKEKRRWRWIDVRSERSAGDCTCSSSPEFSLAWSFKLVVVMDELEKRGCDSVVD